VRADPDIAGGSAILGIDSVPAAMHPAALPALDRLLTEGGDARIALSPGATTNQYGCRPFPDPGLLGFGSSTASVISEGAYAAAARLHRRLQAELASASPASVYSTEIVRLRTALRRSCGLGKRSGVDIVFAASGTDLHLIAGRLAGSDPTAAATVILMDARETGRGVPPALAGCHFGNRAALGTAVSQGEALYGALPVDSIPVALRSADGAARPAAEIDAEVEKVARNALAAGKRVLLTLIDVSKTGLLAPSPACVRALQCAAPGRVEVLVDACQWRLAPATLHAYLDNGFLVALTGSKFITGPTFSGALLVPPAAARRLRDRTLPEGLSAYSSAADWPAGWHAAARLSQRPNFGLLLRWEAALHELNAFRALPEAAVAAFLRRFAEAVGARLANDPRFEPLPVPLPDRRPLAGGGWDALPTIFPFLLYRCNAGGQRRLLDRDATQALYRLLADDAENPASNGAGLATVRCQLGQPVHCGERNGVAISALRICASARLAVEAIAGGRQQEVIQRALAVLDTAAERAVTVPLSRPY